MTTQIIEASQGNITEEMQKVADFEMQNPQDVRRETERGEIVIFKNKQRNTQEPIGIGRNLGVKVCTSFDVSLDDTELLDMFKIIKTAGSGALLEKSACGNLTEKRKKLLNSTTLPYGTFPFFQSVFENLEKNNSLSKLSKKKIIADIEAQVSAGVDFVVINPSLTSEIYKSAKEQNIEVFSDSSKLVSLWMEATDKENPYYEAFDEVLDVLRTYDTALSLELSLKNTSVLDFMNGIQMQELVMLGGLARKAKSSGVQVFVDVVGNIAIDNIEYFIKTVRKITGNTPIMATKVNSIDFKDNNLTGASVASTLMAFWGADFIQSVELPKTSGYFNAKALKESIDSALVSSKIADCAKNNKKAVDIEEKCLKEKKQKEPETTAEFLRKVFS